MIGEEAVAGFDFAALRRALEGADPKALLAFYAEDVRLRVENADLPDGPAFKLKGKGQIERYLRAICDEEMSRMVEGGPDFGERSVSFVEVCEYPDGTRISVSTTLEVGRGLIGRQTDMVERIRSDGTEGGERRGL